MAKNIKQKIVVVDNGFHKILDSCRANLKLNFIEWHKNRRLKLIEKRIKDVTIQEIKAELN